MNIIESKRKGNKLLLSYIRDGILVNKTINNFKPTLFYSLTDPEGEYEDIITGEKVTKVNLESVDAYYELEEVVSKTDHNLYHRHMTPDIQLIKEIASKTANIDSGEGLYWYIDIETTTDKGIDAFNWAKSGQGEVVMIQIATNRDDVVRVLHYYDWSPEPGDARFDKHTILKYSSELEMFDALLDIIEEDKPTILNAHFGGVFDYPFLINRYGELKGLKNPANKFSPFNASMKQKVSTFAGVESLSYPIGLPMLDFVEIYKHVTFGNRMSWSLDYLSQYELGEGVGKIPYYERGFKSIHEFVRGEYDPAYDKDKNSLLRIAYSDGDLQQLRRLWLDLFFEYGIEDVVLLKAVDKKLNATSLIIGVANIFKCNIQDVFGTVKPWMIHLANSAIERNKLLPHTSTQEDYSITGGYVSANPGLHKDTVIFDYTSLYPFCIMDLDMSMETYIEYEDLPEQLFKDVQDKLRMTQLANKYIVDRKIVTDSERDVENPIPRELLAQISEARDNCEDGMVEILEEHGEELKELLVKHNMSMAPNGVFFKKDPNALIPFLIRNLYNDRNASQAKMHEAYDKIELVDPDDTKRLEDLKDEANSYSVEEKITKVLLNSLFGFITSNYASIANADIGAAITSYGRFNIKEMTQHIMGHVDKIRQEKKSTVKVLQDTDSFHLAFKFVPATLTDKKARTRWIYDYTKEHITPEIASHSKEISSWFNGNGLLKMDFEGIAVNEIVVAKKRYVCELWYDDKFLDKPKKKIIGIEIKRSSTPDIIKKVMDKVLDLIFEGDEGKVIQFLEAFKKKYVTLSLVDIAIPSKINNLEKYYVGEGSKRRFILKGATMTAKASHHHNYLIDNFEGFEHIDPIVSGDGFKLLHLKTPLISEMPIQTIGFQDPSFLVESGIEEQKMKYIDYNTQYDKTFMTPIKSIIHTIGWETDPKKFKNRNVL